MLLLSRGSDVNERVAVEQPLYNVMENAVSAVYPLLLEYTSFTFME